MVVKKKSQEQAKEARTWVASDEGKDKITEAINRAKKSTLKLREARRVDPKSQRRPMTI